MLLAGMATRTFCATASPVPEKPVQRKTAKENPRRKSDTHFVFALAFMLHSFQSALFATARKTGGVYGNPEFLSIEILLFEERDRCRSWWHFRSSVNISRRPTRIFLPLAKEVRRDFEHRSNQTQ